MQTAQFQALNQPCQCGNKGLFLLCLDSGPIRTDRLQHQHVEGRWLVVPAVAALSHTGLSG